MKKPRFEGWYFKHQAGGKSLALIPGRAADKAFIQIVTDTTAHIVPFPLSQYSRKGDVVTIGTNRFSPMGVRLNISTPDVALTGKITYSTLTPLKSNIMGPFRFFPMECTHGVVSMGHDIRGKVRLNGVEFHFDGGRGYIESDSGTSFPSDYTWVHCNDFSHRNCSIMVAVARIPFCRTKFWGCITVVHLDGREYRLATYRGVKILRCTRKSIVLKQGRHELSITLDESGHSLSLPAPSLGKMSNLIREKLSCGAHFRFTEGSKILFDGWSSLASHEWEMGGAKG
ncbi:MAG: hypothetical protein FWB93_06320 [Oscillospiraceae bacterium]|nr:hypothetical protein [Oscillospiraceae bacterium]